MLSRIPQWLGKIGVGIAAGVVFWLVMIMIFEEQMIYFPAKYPEGNWQPRASGMNLEDCFFTTEDGVRLHGWFYPAQGARPEKLPLRPLTGTRFTLLWCHGNAGNITHRLENLRLLHELGINVFIFDYRGYGKSEGDPNEEGIYRDAVAAYDYLMTRKDIQPDWIVLFGRSLGTAVAVDLALKRKARALILESAFTTAKDMANEIFPLPIVQFVIRSSFDSLKKIRKIPAPILFIHGNQDRTVPIELGRKLFEVANQPKSFYEIDSADHNDTYIVGGKPYFEEIRKFLESLETR
ncbi:MAG: alpha/beta hydrolase [Bacteroidota bacterium]